MEITEIGKYRMTERKRFYLGVCTFELREGTEFLVTQLDKDARKFYSPTIGDWQYFEQPVEKLS